MVALTCDICSATCHPSRAAGVWPATKRGRCGGSAASPGSGWQAAPVPHDGWYTRVGHVGHRGQELSGGTRCAQGPFQQASGPAPTPSFHAAFVATERHAALQVAERFSPTGAFTCEWKYDGERVQVRVGCCTLPFHAIIWACVCAGPGSRPNYSGRPTPPAVRVERVH
jgi:hypothetical protein